MTAPPSELLDESPLDAPGPGAWTRLARCRSTPTSLFFPGRGDDVEAAREVCRRCPVRAECAEYATPLPWLSGVWGGTTGRERRAARAGQAAAAAARAPLPRSPDGALYRTLAELAAEHPGRWAVVARYASRRSAAAVASNLRAGRIGAPPGRWSFEAHRTEAGSALWARLDEADERLEEPA